ncbi:hypothetical protein chiPu_0030071, partial [Chiloscyllium punctatum]|nr:hypothetical protein [Chiloscyllium punctatum]
MAVPLASEPIGRGFQPMAAAVTVLSGDGGEGVKMGGVKLEIFR